MSVSILEALDIIATEVTPLSDEIIPIEDAVGRIVSQDYEAVFDLPRFDNSAMDGYIVKVADAGQKVIQTDIIYAGDKPLMRLEDKQAIKIMTGAPIPKGGEVVVPIEHTTQEGKKILLPSELKQKNFIRLQGEDIKKGTCFLKSGTRINAYTIASLASQGISHITVTRIIKVAIFATGDELRPHFEKIESHQLYNSNSPMFLTRCATLGCTVRLVHTAQDTLEALKDSIRSTLDADIIITSGGVSVGDKDFTKEAFSILGMQRLIDSINIKPGRPTSIGKIEETIVVNLPGNPLAAMVNYELFVRAIIKKLSGNNDFYHHTIKTKMKYDFSSKGGKYTVILGRFNGEYFEALKPQMPGMVSPMSQAQGCLLITPDVTSLKAEEVVRMIPISWEFFSEKKEVLFTK